ncbi:NAD-dependent epimerase/dehydratase family protein [Paenibacillus thermotolerans]|uniref:NAD-dependent epimerase/dehydratase family protein n=1 Tax=Paenibacillus thermotolerans TaxID=3027807 RepID=UPI00236750BF|nr:MULTISPECIES: NAD-dependent epimerase/dehydratase family protein [unclassified Paenibacillus]
MTKVFVTGVAGFLGSQLAKELVSSGCEVVGADNLSSGKIDNLRDLLASNSFRFIYCDITKDRVLHNPILTGVQQIYHLASPASPKLYQADPFATVAANTKGTKNMLELARKTGAKILFSSTSEAYGDPEVHPQAEDYCGNVKTWSPRACYDESKRMGEVFCYEYYKQFGVPVKVARIFNTYSAALRNDDGRVISNFITQALTESDITVYGDGTQTRSFCYIDDTLRGLRLMMERDEANGEIINIGNESEYSVLQVARKVKELTGSPSRIVHLPLPPDDPKKRCPSIAKARKLLGWSPVVGLEEGLRLTIEVYRSKRASVRAPLSSTRP